MQKLSPYLQTNHQSHSVMGSTTVSDGKVIAEFWIDFKDKLVTNSKFTRGSIENWGLWEYDVVEIFLSRHEKGLPYLEVQVSPLEQLFALEVLEPRKKFHYPSSSNIECRCQIEAKRWIAKIVIPLSMIPGSSEKLIGNLHSCLGEGKRGYFGQFLSDKVDFHRPEFFSQIGEIK